MKLLKCKICLGEVEIVNEHSVNRKIKCYNCANSINVDNELKQPEVFSYRKKIIID